LAPAGQGEIITDASFSDSTRAFDANGRLIPIPAYRKFTLGTYIEYGLTDRITLVAQPSVDTAHQDLQQPEPPVVAASDLGARIGLVSFGSTVLSVQALGHLPFVASARQAGYFDQNLVPGADLRLLLGHGFTLGNAPAFFDAEVSHEWQGDGLPQEWHVDLTVGLRPYPRVLVMLAGFFVVAGPPSGACSAWTACWRWLKLQPSIVYDLSAHWSAELGVFATVAGINAGRELGPMVALWYRF